MRPKDPNAGCAKEVAASALEGIKKAGLDGVATVLLGFSFGAVIAYEIAILLSEMGLPPLGLVVASAEHPGWKGRAQGAGKNYGPTTSMDDGLFEKMLRDKKGTDMVLAMPG